MLASPYEKYSKYPTYVGYPAAEAEAAKPRDA